MKKAWKWVLAAVGIPLVCLGLLVLEGLRRTNAAIAEEAAALARDIASFRSRLPPSGARSAKLEEGHRGLVSAKSKLLRADATDVPLSSSPRVVFEALSKGDDYFREAGYLGSQERIDFEQRALRRLQEALASRDYDAAELREFRDALEQVRARRPSVADVAAAEYLLDRAEILTVLRLGDDPHGTLRRGPGWRELHSRRIRAIHFLRQLEEYHREIQQLIQLPPAEAERASHGWTGSFSDANDLGRTELKSDLWLVYSREREFQREWAFTRVILALRLFERETGRELKRLEDLVPVYSPKVPVSPVESKPYHLTEGVLFDGDGKSRLDLRRR